MACSQEAFALLPPSWRAKVGARTADVVAANVIKRIDPLLELVEGTADTTQGIIMDTRRAANMLYSTYEDVRDKIHKAAKQAKEELWRVTEGARDELLKATEELGKVVAAVGTFRHSGVQNPWDGTLGEDRELIAEARPYMYVAALTNGCPWHTPAP